MVAIASLCKASTILLASLGLAVSQRLECPLQLTGLAANMVESTISRGQGLAVSNASTGNVELGLFQQALRESIAYTDSSQQKTHWQEILTSSVLSANITLSNATRNTELPLDRLSIGTAIIREYERTKNETYRPTIKALQQSIAWQPRNTNNGLWYYANPKNLTAYQNLSYLDGMFSYAPFAIISSGFNFASDTLNLNEAAAWEQVSILKDITKRGDGLFVHGYDAIKKHRWADPETGASPVVWARSLAWYTLGVVNSLELLQMGYSDLKWKFGQLFCGLVEGQLRAGAKSLQIEGSYGVWQVVDRPVAVFDGAGNFIEASASLMTAYSLLKGARLGLLGGDDLKLQAQVTGLGIFQTIRQRYLIENSNGTLSLNGTSSVSTLSGDVDYKYYVTRPTVLNSLIGTSAFILAALEAEKLCS